MTLEEILAETTRLLGRAQVSGASVERMRFLQREVERLKLEVGGSLARQATCGHAVRASFSDHATDTDRARILQHMGEQDCPSCADVAPAGRP